MSDGERNRAIGLGRALQAMAPGSLAPPLPPAASLSDEIRRLIAAHGADAVKTEIRAATKPPRGRRRHKDMILFKSYLEADARDWLTGRNPFALRKNKAIAREVAQANPRPNVQPDSILRHFERRLAANRKRYMLYFALSLSELEYPYPAHFRVLEELAKREGDVWRRGLAMDREILARYREVYGEPDETMTWKELEAKPRYAGSLGGLLALPAGGIPQAT